MAITSAKVCPECGKKLDGIDVQAHAAYHYPDPFDERRESNRTSKLRRAALLSGGVSPEMYARRDRESSLTHRKDTPEDGE